MFTLTSLADNDVAVGSMVESSVGVTVGIKVGIANGNADGNGVGSSASPHGVWEKANIINPEKRIIFFWFGQRMCRCFAVFFSI